MREIKFRAWDKDNKEMLQVELLGEDALKGFDNGWGDREDFEVMQFTGLHDKNGREIYEGDIVSQCRGEEWELTYEVRWNNSRCGFWLYFRNEPRLDLNNERELEVIGNIYGNPELRSQMEVK